MPTIYLKLVAKSRAYVVHEHATTGSHVVGNVSAHIRLTGYPRLRSDDRESPFTLLRDGRRVDLPRQCRLSISADTADDAAAGSIFTDLRRGAGPDAKEIVVFHILARISPVEFANLCRVLGAGGSTGLVARASFDLPDKPVKRARGAWDVTDPSFYLQGVKLKSFYVEALSGNSLPASQRKRVAEERASTDARSEALHKSVEALAASSTQLSATLERISSSVRLIMTISLVSLLLSLWRCAQ